MHQKGVTLVETVIAATVISIAALGIYQGYAYGSAFIEKMGLRRQAISILKGEAELWRAWFREAKPGRTPSAADVGVRNRQVLLSKPRNLQAEVVSKVSCRHRQGPLEYCRISVTLRYENGLLADTLDLRTRHYVQRE